MGKQKPKLTPAEKAKKKRRQREYMTVFIRRNADPIWLLQNEMYEELHQWELAREDSQPQPAVDSEKADRLDDDLPF